MGKEPPTSAGDRRDSDLVPGLGRSPGGGRAIHSSTPAWRIPWIEEPGHVSVSSRITLEKGLLHSQGNRGVTSMVMVLL